MLLKKGMKMPDFTLPDNQDGHFTLSDLQGKKVLLSWHPLAWTSVCTDQMRALEANYDRFEALNAVPVGLSVDPAASKKVWAQVLSIRKTKLLADFYPHGQLAKQLDLFNEEIGASRRANIIVDGEGVIQWVKVYENPQLPDLNEVFEALGAI